MSCTIFFPTANTGTFDNMFSADLLVVKNKIYYQLSKTPTQPQLHPTSTNVLGLTRLLLFTPIYAVEPPIYAVEPPPGTLVLLERMIIGV